MNTLVTLKLMTFVFFALGSSLAKATGFREGACALPQLPPPYEHERLRATLTADAWNSGDFGSIYVEQASALGPIQPINYEKVAMSEGYDPDYPKGVLIFKGEAFELRVNRVDGGCAHPIYCPAKLHADAINNGQELPLVCDL